MDDCSRGDFNYTASYCEENVHHLCSRLVERGVAQSLDSLHVTFISNALQQVPIWQQRAGHPSREGLVVWDYHVVLIQQQGPQTQAPSQQQQQQQQVNTGAAGPAAATPFTHPESEAREDLLSGGLPGLADSTSTSSSGVCGGGRGSRSHSGTQDPPICVHAVVWDLDTSLPFPCSLQQYAADALRRSSELTGARERLFRVVPARTFLDSFASDRSHMLRADGSWVAAPPAYPAIRPVQGSSCRPRQTMNLLQYFTMTAPPSPQHPALSHTHSPTEGGGHDVDGSLASGARFPH
ncbi:MAG: hypothetical protein WDW38_011179 [Sanguina aurantia]